MSQGIESWIRRTTADLAGYFACGESRFISKCPSGLHQVVEELRNTHSTEWRNTGSFRIIQGWNNLNNLDCVRYIRQYMFLHMPQLDQAVIEALSVHTFAGRTIRILDVGSGPGTLFFVLAALFESDHPAVRPYKIEYCALEKASLFRSFLEKAVQQFPLENLKLEYVGDLDTKSVGTDGIDWFFFGNVLGPIIRCEGGSEGAVNRIGRYVSDHGKSRCFVTVAESTDVGAGEFKAFCQSLRSLGKCKQWPAQTCRGTWLKHCRKRKIYVTGWRRPTIAWLRLVTCSVG